jgi:hypothetical protein
MKKLGLCAKCFNTEKSTVLTEVIKYANRKKRRGTKYKTAKRLVKQGYDEVCLDCFYEAMGGKEYEKYLQRNKHIKELSISIENIKHK